MRGSVWRSCRRRPTQPLDYRRGKTGGDRAEILRNAVEGAVRHPAGRRTGSPQGKVFRNRPLGFVATAICSPPWRPLRPPWRAGTAKERLVRGVAAAAVELPKADKHQGRP